MSMLAGPRRKQKVINLRAKNNAWSNDTNKFGQRMLEKMGWSAGKGLGANENGIVEHVIAKYKNDEKGLGFEDKNDQWTKHEDDFNSLLANLSNNSENNADTLHSGVSLEVKSKKSKARIHYHKYTRGKDLSRYSEKDLANIFGKKSFKEETVEEPLKDEVNVTEKKFTEKGNMDDYFKSKLASLKIKSKLLSNDNNEKEDVDYGFQGFSLQPPGEGENQDDQDSEILENEPEKAVKSKKKKKSKQKDNMGEKCDSLQVNEMSDQLSVEETLPVKQKKLKKKKLQDVDSEIIENNEVKKKKSKRNQECVSQDDDSLQNHIESVDNNIPKKKKKRKNKE